MNDRRNKTTLIYVGFASPQGKRPANPWKLPAPGIWWAVDANVVALLQLPQRSERSGPFLDSTLAHVDEWPEVANLFGRSRDSRYFDVPRGRVLLKRRTGGAVIYHGNETTLATLQHVAQAFNVEDWSAAIDEHYLMGTAADQLFND